VGSQAGSVWVLHIVVEVGQVCKGCKEVKQSGIGLSSLRSCWLCICGWVV